MLTLQALIYTERYGQTARTIWNYAKGTVTLSKRPDSIQNQVALSIATVEKRVPMQVVKQPENGKDSATREQKCSSFQMNYD